MRKITQPPTPPSSTFRLIIKQISRFLAEIFSSPSNREFKRLKDFISS